MDQPKKTIITIICYTKHKKKFEFFKNTCIIFFNTSVGFKLNRTSSFDAGIKSVAIVQVFYRGHIQKVLF